MNRRHFRTHAELERQINAARQLRSDIILAGARRAFAALTRGLRPFAIAVDRPAAGVGGVRPRTRRPA